MTTTIMTLNLRKKFSHLREQNGLSMVETVAQKQQLLKVRLIAKQRLTITEVYAFKLADIL
jgi:hypothetical protein